MGAFKYQNNHKLYTKIVDKAIEDWGTIQLGEEATRVVFSKIRTSSWCSENQGSVSQSSANQTKILDRAPSRGISWLRATEDQ